MSNNKVLTSLFDIQNSVSDILLKVSPAGGDLEGAGPIAI
jgi:hypothetical protein